MTLTNHDTDDVQGPRWHAWPNRETGMVYRDLAGDPVDVKHATDTARRHVEASDRVEAAWRTGQDLARYVTAKLRQATRTGAPLGRDLAVDMGNAALQRVSWTTVGMAFVWRAEHDDDEPVNDDEPEGAPWT